MAIYLLTFIVCLTISSFMVVALVLTRRTSRYRTDPEQLLSLIDSALACTLSENEWNAVIGYPIRHDPYLESLRRRCQAIMDNHGQPWLVERNGRLFSTQGMSELEAIRVHLNARLTLRRSNAT
ncbi:hypothetical protein [Larsenimonas suaedae]|uniref:Uncharacterized protein n=1 Tax=Larsenimonas suaedae TaxID=1851019 RepID=A0ABU1GV61_9GAMM|nr:hypothetical protein [Larsenimonas suaedae]MCM2971226.1 hypothetical protein [Larsenimonas suaedae]MDR5895935.1 hypothetical protein [Larsenimonas suaedae]